MMNFEFWFTPECLIFSLAIVLLCMIAILEGVLMMIGGSIAKIFSLFESEIHLDFDMPGVSSLSKLLGWLHVGRVPALVLLVFFLATFGLIGLMGQALAYNWLGIFLPTFIAVTLSFFLACMVVRIIGKGLSQLIPTDESAAIRLEDLVGKVATIVTGIVRKGLPAQAVVKDRFNQLHYVYVEPNDEQVFYGTGHKVLLINFEGARFHAIEVPDMLMTE